MQYRFVKAYFTQPFAIILCLGLFLLTLGLLYLLPEFWSTFLQVVGTSFIAVALSAPISEFFQFQTLSKYMGVVRGAQDCGIVHIFKSRSEDRTSFQEALEREFAQADRILFSVIAFPQLFHNRPFPKSIDDKMFNPDIPVKILLLDPTGKNAQERAAIETGRGVFLDIQRSLAALNLILKEMAGIKDTDSDISDNVIERARFGVHIYNFPPICFLIMTDKCLFLEQYHFGRLPNTRPGECIGSRTPIFQFTSHTLTYKIMEQHFDYIWERKSQDITRKLLNEEYFLSQINKPLPNKQ